LSVVPLRVIPPPSAVALEGLATEPNSIFLSSTVSVVELTVVVVPLTVKSPLTVKLPAVIAPVDVIAANTGEEVVEISCAVEITPVVLLYVIPVPAETEARAREVVKYRFDEPSVKLSVVFAPRAASNLF